MQIKEIFYSPHFNKQFKLLPQYLKLKALKAENLFRINPFYPSLRLHKLKGKLDGSWSISIDYKYRIIFKPLQDGLILFVSIGLHTIYDT